MSNACISAKLACFIVLFCSAFGFASEKGPIEAIPEFVDKFLVEYCLDCHDEVERKGEVSLDFVEIDWSDPHATNLWAKVHEMLEAGEMPPKKKKQPSAAEQHSVASWLDEMLVRNDPPGGTVLRRLNRQEYENSVSDVLGIPFTAPESFPSDLEHHGFDNVGSGLVISPPLMAQYFEIATKAADIVIPAAKEREVVPIETSLVGPNDFTLNFTTGHPIDGVLRMVSSSDPLARSSVWPNRFEAKVTGRYQATLKLSSYRPVEGHRPIVKLLAFRTSQNSFTRASTLRELAEVRVDGEQTERHEVEVDLQKGETVVIHYENADLSSDGEEGSLERIADILQQVFREDPLLGAAWKEAGYQRSDRGWSWWHRIQKIKNRPGFSARGFDPDLPETRDFILKMARTKNNIFETLCCYRFFQGPGLDVHELAVTGPMLADRKTYELTPKDFTSVDFSGTLTETDRYRLVSSRNTVGGSVASPSRFEAKVSGVYSVVFDAASFEDARALFEAKNDSFLIELFARKSVSDKYDPIDSMRKLAEFRLNAKTSQFQTFSAEVELAKGETIGFRWGNSPLYSEEGNRQFSPKAFERLVNDKRIHAAYLKLGRARELTPPEYYTEIMKLVDSDDLDTSDPELQKVPDLSIGAARNAFTWIAVQDLIRYGPALDLRNTTIEGPLRLVEDNEMKVQRLRTARFMGERQGRSDSEYATAILQRFLDRAFRRPATADQVTQYVEMTLAHASEGYRFEDGIHLAIRAAFCSPSFLYRGLEDGPLDEFDLASRLSYFLTSSPPDERLLKRAAEGTLSDPNTLAKETRRLLAGKRVQHFLDSFTGQWLDLRLLPEIMPDVRLLNWNDNYLEAITAETEMFIAEILRENHPIETFIDPDFTYLNRHNAKLYDHPFKGGNAMERVALERGGRYGGILGQASVMMATANGVDTQPVLRGVWLLENVLGDPVPEPPSNVPSVEPDTSGAQSIRELLQRHQEDENCASCHRKIDPPGFALENFDPVGRWRTHYPVFEKKGDKVVALDGQEVDAKGQLVDGTGLNDVTDLKRYLVDNIDIFSHCLAEKLMVYATGREPSFGDRKELDRIVARAKERGNGFQDLIVELVLSESFLTK